MAGRLEFRLGKRLTIAAVLLAASTAASLAVEPELMASCRAKAPRIAIEACGAIIDTPDEDRLAIAEALFLRGRSYARQQKFKLAIADLTNSLALEPDRAAAFNQRGYARLEVRRFDEARTDLETAISLKPKFALAYHNLGVLDLATGAPRAAIANFDQALRLRPRLFVAHVFRSVAHAQLGEIESAIADLDIAITLNPDGQLIVANRAVQLMRLGRFEAAAADLRHVLAARPRRGHELDQHAHRIAGETFEQLRSQRPDLTSEPIAPPEERAAAVPGRRIALVVGNGAYLSSGALKNPPRDAHAIAGALRRLGFDDVRERIDLSRADFETELRAFGADAAGADWAVIYYAGHGIEFDGANHVVPVDAAVRTAEAAEDETIALDMLIENVEPAGKLRLIILDACRDNPFAAQSTDKELTRAFGRGLARIEPSNVLVAYAAHHGQVALDGKGDNSPYVEALLEYLPAPGLEISLMFRKVHDRVFERTGDAQEPFTYGSLSGDPLYFKPR